MLSVLLLISSLLFHSTVSMRSSSQIMLSNLTLTEKALSLKNDVNVPSSSDLCIVKNGDGTSKTGFANTTNCSDDVVHALHWTADNFLHLNNSNQYIAPEHFCVISRNATEIKYSATLSSFPNWRKCCSQDQLVTGPNFNTCIATMAPYRLTINQKMASFSVLDNLNLNCSKGSFKAFFNDSCALQSQTGFRITSDGVIEYQTPIGIFLRITHWKSLNLSRDLDYCLDGVVKLGSNCYDDDDNVKIDDSPTRLSISNADRLQSSTSSHSIDCGYSSIISGKRRGDRQQRKQMTFTILLACVQSDPEPSSSNISLKAILLAVLWLLTIPLLLGAALGNCCVIQTNVHGLILSCYLVSMSVLNVVSAIYFVKLGIGQGGSEKECHPMDFVMKFTYMSTLCWMSSINFGLHKTFRYTLPRPVGIQRFVASVIFSLGFPAISVTATFYAATAYLDQSCNDLDYCVLYHSSTIPFYTAPLYTLVLVNFAIFLKTIYVIAVLKKETGDVLKLQRDHMKSFALFAKLFLLAGCIWILRLVLFILQIFGVYFMWYGVFLEIIYTTPDVVFPMIVFHHPEFIKWCWNRNPVISRFILKFNPLFNVRPAQQNNTA